MNISNLYNAVSQALTLGELAFANAGIHSWGALLRLRHCLEVAAKERLTSILSTKFGFSKLTRLKQSVYAGSFGGDVGASRSNLLEVGGANRARLQALVFGQFMPPGFTTTRHSREALESQPKQSIYLLTISRFLTEMKTPNPLHSCISNIRTPALLPLSSHSRLSFELHHAVHCLPLSLPLCHP